MKIGIIAPLWISVPPKNMGTGAQEMLCYYITEGLRKKGHKVTLFASGDSKTSAHLVSICDQQLMDSNSPTMPIRDTYELINLSIAYEMAKDFDIIHNHLLPQGLLFADIVPTPTVHTLHQRIYTDRPEIILYTKFKEQNIVSISQAQRHVLPTLNYASTVYNGVDTNFHEFNDTPHGDYLLCIGRMRPYKGFHHAVQLAKALSKTLLIAAPSFQKDQHTKEEIERLWDEEYYHTYIQPYLSDTIRFIGEVNGKDKVKIMQNAKALIFPVEREEPFGMTVIEAMSCGTPIISYANGAMPELILDGKTGYLVNDKEDKQPYQVKKIASEGLLEATEKLYALSPDAYTAMRKECREHVVKHFSIEQMVDNYEKVYQKILQG